MSVEIELAALCEALVPDELADGAFIGVIHQKYHQMSVISKSRLLFTSHVHTASACTVASA